MSTKTTFKRIALVAVAALGLGVLSVAPSSATVSGLTVTVADGTAGLPNVRTDSTTAATINVAGLVEVGDTITISTVLKSYPTGGSGATKADAVSLQNLDSTTGALASGYTLKGTDSATTVTLPSFAVLETSTAGVRVSGLSATKNISHNFGLQFDSTVATGRIAGTYTYTVVVKAFNKFGDASGPSTTITKDVSIVIAAAASASTTPSGAKSFARLTAGSTTLADGVVAAVDSAVAAVATAGTVAGYVYVGVRNADGTLYNVAQDSVTASITGAGVLCDSSNVCGTSLKIATTGDLQLSVKADGRSGVATINISTLVATYAAKTVTFYAAAAKTITTTVRHPVLKVGTNTGAIGVSAVDANGTAWTGTAYLVASSAADALIAGSTTPVACTAWNATDGIRCDVPTIAAGTAKFKVIDAATVAAATATSAEFSVTVSSTLPSGVKISFDKASYQPYEKAVITVTPVDAAGSNVSANTYSSLLASGGIVSNIAFTGTSDTLTASDITTSAASSSTTGAVAGSKVYVVYMPAQGDVTISAKGGTGLPAAGQVAVSATASVVNSSVDAATDAANEATDAANAATDAALAAADAADAATAAAQDASDAVAALSATVAKLVASLKAQITSLTNLVIKIQKKVKA